MGVETELESLRVISPQASLVHEGGVTWVLLPMTHLTVPGGGIEVMDTVLCATGQGGYATRLLLERQVTGKTLNWTQVMALGRNWHTWSWQDVPANQSWLQIFAEHTRILR
jgi:hypothetical protein